MKRAKLMLGISAIIVIVICLSVVQIPVYIFPENSLNPAHWRYKVYAYSDFSDDISVFYCNYNPMNDSEKLSYLHNIVNFTQGSWYTPRYYTAPVIVAWLPLCWKFHADVITLSEGASWKAIYTFNEITFRYDVTWEMVK